MKDSILNLVIMRIAQGYDNQLPYYEKMLSLSREQENCLSAEEINTEELLGLIEQRQELINSLEMFNHDINALKKEVCGIIGWEEFNISTLRQSKIPGADSLCSSLDKLAVILQLIKELDKKNEDVLKMRLQQTKGKISNVQNTKFANKAYHKSNVYNDGVFIDTTK